jgi:hypothetical protein
MTRTACLQIRFGLTPCDKSSANRPCYVHGVPTRAESYPVMDVILQADPIRMLGIGSSTHQGGWWSSGLMSALALCVWKQDGGGDVMDVEGVGATTGGGKRKRREVSMPLLL